jgi:conjugal transfer/entry exclusion protein
MSERDRQKAEMDSIVKTQGYNALIQMQVSNYAENINSVDCTQLLELVDNAIECWKVNPK